MEDQFAARDRAFERRGVAQVAGDGLDVEVLQFAGGTDEGADFVSACGQRVGDVPAEEARRASNEGHWSHVTQALACPLAKKTG